MLCNPTMSTFSQGKIGVDAEEAHHLMTNLNFKEAATELAQVWKSECIDLPQDVFDLMRFTSGEMSHIPEIITHHSSLIRPQLTCGALAAARSAAQVSHYTWMIGRHACGIDNSLVPQQYRH